tara:strand:- start:440 stop:631 length:192 start_codon:yes stop_codon:yes gene_type:complete
LIIKSERQFDSTGEFLKVGTLTKIDGDTTEEVMSEQAGDVPISADATFAKIRLSPIVSAQSLQ